jgi:hypothetical protein
MLAINYELGQRRVVVGPELSRVAPLFSFGDQSATLARIVDMDVKHKVITHVKSKVVLIFN